MTTAGEWEDRNRRQFDRLAGGYDRLGFLTQAARFVAAQVVVPPGGAALDVMTGTGSVALALLGRSGSVVGLDLSAGMVEVARRRVPGAQFVVGDAAHLPFPDGSFDVVVCASGLFFVPDMGAALREWRRVVRPSGQVVFSSFGRGLLGDLPGLWRARLEAHGVRPGAAPLGRIPTPDAARDLLLGAGLDDVQVDRTDLPYTLACVGDRWDEIAAGLEGQPLAGFTPDLRAQVQAEHRADLAPLFAGGPVTVPLPVIVARGTRPE
ncbi:class I SAM-dependent methyltransferase [Deinococcus knuensis]|uniref:Methyltransferase n=1 Tax=Deinococcus knuensis TaxID=1837380 RepID=A0ABQ2SFQ7_9DEIO|nr:methyltransferase domain-containing protein [Deinococcus knuensis]GGS27030.1 methyltransferase [Deinococcus knuensis]